MTTRVLHVLPHRGGGAETYIDLLDALPNFDSQRAALSRHRTPIRAAGSIMLGYRRVAARARRADLLHVHGDMAAVLCLPLVRTQSAVWTTHGLHFLRRARGWRGQAFRSALQTAIKTTARTICTSMAEREELVTLAGPGLAERIVVVRNGIEPRQPVSRESREAMRSSLPLHPDDIAVLFAGQLEERKGILEAISAVRSARQRGAPVVLLVAGDGPLAEEVSSAGEGVHLLGPRRDLDRIYPAVDVFLMPSKREGLSFAVLEAMAAGLALVVTDIPGNTEAVGSAAKLIPCDDSEALAEAVILLASNAAERQRLGSAALIRVQSEFTAASFRTGVEAAYQSALMRGRPSRG